MEDEPVDIVGDSRERQFRRCSRQADRTDEQPRTSSFDGRRHAQPERGCWTPCHWRGMWPLTSACPWACGDGFGCAASSTTTIPYSPWSGKRCPLTGRRLRSNGREGGCSPSSSITSRRPLSPASTFQSRSICCGTGGSFSRPALACLDRSPSSASTTVGPKS